MSLKPPNLWIEQRGLQHRVYWRTAVPGLPTRSSLRFYGRAEAEQFVGMPRPPGLDTARKCSTPTIREQPRCCCRKRWPSGTSRPPTGRRRRSRPPMSAAPAGAPVDPRLPGVTFHLGRDPAEGGLGLHLVAECSGAHGWTLQSGHKEVWARVDRVQDPGVSAGCCQRSTGPAQTLAQRSPEPGAAAASWSVSACQAVHIHSTAAAVPGCR